MSHSTHYRSFPGHVFTGQMTKPKVSQHWRKPVGRQSQAWIPPEPLHHVTIIQLRSKIQQNFLAIASCCGILECSSRKQLLQKVYVLHWHKVSFQEHSVNYIPRITDNGILYHCQIPQSTTGHSAKCSKQCMMTLNVQFTSELQNWSDKNPN